MSVKSMVRLAILTGLAVILGILDHLLPSPTNLILGAKLGLANSLTLLCLYCIGPSFALTMNVLRVTLVAILVGSFSTFYYSLAGALLSVFAMLFIKRLGNNHVSVIGVSVTGAFGHHLGQLALAAFFSQTWIVFNYLPLLSLTGIVTGLFTGWIVHLLLNHAPNLAIIDDPF